jgi:predicted nucleic acid-binding protein
VTAYFCDSSAIIKRYTIEAGSAYMIGLASPQSGAQIFVAQITQVEVISGLARLYREGIFMAQTLFLARQSVNYHVSRDYDVIAFSERIIQRAEEMLLQHPLRGYDAVQLASALDLRARLLVASQITPVFVSADRRLLAAAEAEGLITDDPNQHA